MKIHKSLNWWIGTHLVAFAVAYAAGKNSLQKTTVEVIHRVSDRALDRDAESRISSDGGVLLETFRREQQTTPYQALKETLPVAADVKAAALEAMERWAAAPIGEEKQACLIEMQVRFLHWMRQDPNAAVEAILADGEHSERAAQLLFFLGNPVATDVATEKGLLASLPWLAKIDHESSIVASVALADLKAGGGLAYFLKLERAVADGPFERMFSSKLRSYDPGTGSMTDSFLRRAAKLFPFSDKDRLLQVATRRADSADGRDLLLGFAQSRTAATEWLLGLVNSGGLPEELAGGLRSSLGNEIMSHPDLDMETRVAARRATKGNETKARQSIIDELVADDLKRLLTDGRDWRYEFHHGVSSLEDVVKAVNEGMPGVPDEARDGLNIALFRHLAEENSQKAMALLDSLPDEKRRAALFDSTWTCFVNNNPDDYLRHLSSLPEPETPKEKDERTKGWNWKARGCLERYGDDYVEWVQQMPPGLDKDTAMRSLIPATREKNPKEARKLEEKLNAPKP